MKKIAISQSNYIPWKGYFDLIGCVDEFVLYDEMQFTRRDWRNRNQIKTPNGRQWLTIPVIMKGKYNQKIIETEVDGNGWRLDHWKALQLNYKKTKYYTEITKIIEPLYLDDKSTSLSQINKNFIEKLCDYLDIRTKIVDSTRYVLETGKSEKLAGICSQAGADVYVSGPSARSYLEENVFSSRGLEIEWMDYADYKEYNQLWGDFVHEVTILDLLFACGKDARKYMKCTRRGNE